MKQLKCWVLTGVMLFSGVALADKKSDDIKKFDEYNRKMKTIPYEIGPLKDPSKLPFKIGKPEKHAKETESWFKNNYPKYKAGSAEMFGDPVLIRFRDQVGYGICMQVSGNQVYAGFNGSLYYLFLFNGDLIVDVVAQTMLLGMDEVDDARVRLLNAEIDQACVSIVASGLELDNPEKPTSGDKNSKATKK